MKLTYCRDMARRTVSMASTFSLVMFLLRFLCLNVILEARTSKPLSLMYSLRHLRSQLREKLKRRSRKYSGLTCRNSLRWHVKSNVRSGFRGKRGLF